MQSYIHFIGTGCGRPLSTRKLPSYLIRLPNGKLVLLEAGATLNSDIHGQYPYINITQITDIIISAMNIELFSGLPSLLHSMRLLNRTLPLSIIAPQSLNFLIADLLKKDKVKISFDIRYYDIENEPSFDFGGKFQLTIRESPFKIGSYQVYLSFLSKEKEILIYYTGKSRGYIDSELLSNFDGYKFVIHDCTYSYDDAYLSKKTGLSSYRDVIAFREKIDAIAVFLVHYSSRYHVPEKDIAKNRIKFDNIIFTHDNYHYDLNYVLSLI